MKKLVTISLLIIYLFNLAGYPFLFRYLAIQSDWKTTANIDKNKYNREDLIEIKVPLNMPYVSNWGGYERFDGEITIGDVHHNYVERKVSGDTLYLLCLPDKESSKLLVAKNEYSKKVNDFDASDKENNTSAKKSNILNHYHQQDAEYAIECPITINTRENTFSISPILHLSLNKDGRPPKVNS